MTDSFHFYNGLSCPSEQTEMRRGTGDDAHQNGRRCAGERAEMRIRTGNHRSGLQKAPQWFCKTTALVFTNHRAAFPFCLRAKPVITVTFARSTRIVRPFRWCCSAALLRTPFAVPVDLQTPTSAPSSPRLRISLLEEREHYTKKRETPAARQGVARPLWSFEALTIWLLSECGVRGRGVDARATDMIQYAKRFGGVAEWLKATVC